MREVVALSTKISIMGALTETPLHAGTGQTLGSIDLPIQRERHTGVPIVPGSSVKGALRAFAVRSMKDKAKLKLVYGPETDRADEHSGALAVTELRVVALPVRSLQEVFYWVTSPMCLARLNRDRALAGLGTLVPEFKVATGQALWQSPESRSLLLEDIDLQARHDKDVGQAAGAIAKLCPAPSPPHEPTVKRLGTHLLVVSDEDMRYFLENTTQVTARVKLSGNKTSENLWYEECLPRDTFLSCLLVARDTSYDGLAMTAAEVLEAVSGLFREKPYLQVGGNETVGCGWCAVAFEG
jgi:CRISPR-associated protein Cmr4